MALSSFTLRKNVSAGGSGNRREFDNSSEIATDNSLRSDGYLEVSPSGARESTFRAEVYSYTEVELTWELDSVLSASATGADFEVTEIIIKSSTSGEPITVKDGFDVVVITNFNINLYLDENSRYTYIDKNPLYVQEGNWVYYTLFGRYENSTGDAFYERLSTLSVQVPRNWGSTQDLWERIPTYYRELDEKLLRELQVKDVSYPYLEGPLYRYTSLFGWELDKIRTTIFDTMRINDPTVIHSSAIDALGYQVGAEITRNALGTSKLRNLLNNIGFLRRTKGTVNSVQAYVAALSGSFVSTITDGASTTFNIHPHRVNLFSDPEIANETGSLNYVDGGVGTYPTYSMFSDLSNSVAGINNCYGWGIYATSSEGLPLTISVNNGEINLSSDGECQVAIYSRTSFNYNPELTYYGSAVSNASFSINFIGWNVIQNIEGGDASTTPTPKTWGVLDSLPLQPTQGRRLVKYPDAPEESIQEVVPCFIFDIPIGTTVTFSKPLFEYNNSSGDYFTGNSIQGGFIEDATGSTLGVYDYYWGESGTGGPHSDFSFYTLDSKRVRQVVENVITEYVMPVNQTKNVDYFINWDVVQ